VVDGAYVDSDTGETCMIEVETRHYTAEQIAQKITFCKAYGGTYEPTRV
jgi:hypothetical protein